MKRIVFLLLLGILSIGLMIGVVLILRAKNEAGLQTALPLNISSTPAKTTTGTVKTQKRQAKPFVPIDRTKTVPPQKPGDPPMPDYVNDPGYKEFPPEG